MTASNQGTNHPCRRPTRLPGYDYARPSAYFVTICSHEQRCILGRVADADLVANAFGDIVRECWLSLPAYHSISLDSFVIMPNHMHGIVLLDGTNDESCSLPQIIRTFKSISARRINKLRNQPGETVWQRGYHEHVVRDEFALDQIRRYIANNPARWQYDRENPAYESMAARRAGLKPAPTEGSDATADCRGGFQTRPPVGDDI